MNSLSEELAKIQAATQKTELSGGQTGQPAGPVTDPEPAFPIRGDVAIEVDWAMCGKSRPKVKISESKMSETLVAYVVELKEALGAEVLTKLTSFKVSRGPLVSQRPATDFINRSTGQLYAHHQVEGTSFHVLTHSSTPEKFDAIRESWRFLGLPEAALSLRRI